MDFSILQELQKIETNDSRIKKGKEESWGRKGKTLQDSLGTECWAVMAQTVTCCGSVHPSGLCRSELCPGAGPGTLVAAAPCVPLSGTSTFISRQQGSDTRVPWNH